MRLDLDCIHSILVSLADNLQPDEYGDISPISLLREESMFLNHFRKLRTYQ